MDGTLIDSGTVISNTINFVRTNIGLPIIPKQEMLTQLNNPDINSSQYFYGTSAFTDEQTKLFGEYYDKNCIVDIELYDGIYQLLESLSRYFTLSVATNASVEFAQKMLKHLGVYHYFDMVVGANNVKKPKPDPDMLLKTLKCLNIDVKDSILVGDSLKDKNAAKSANMEYLLVNWGFSNHLDDAVSSIDELHNILLKLK